MADWDEFEDSLGEPEERTPPHDEEVEVEERTPPRDSPYRRWWDTLADVGRAWTALVQGSRERALADPTMARAVEQGFGMMGLPTFEETQQAQGVGEYLGGLGRAFGSVLPGTVISTPTKTGATLLRAYQGEGPQARMTYRALSPVEAEIGYLSGGGRSLAESRGLAQEVADYLRRLGFQRLYFTPGEGLTSTGRAASSEARVRLFESLLGLKAIPHTPAAGQYAIPLRTLGGP